MPILPNMATEYSTQEITDVFAGYNHNLKIADGEMFDMLNMTSDYYPLMAPRARRGYVKTLTAPMGMIAKDKLGYVDDGTFYYDGAATALTGLEEGEKQLVGMGALVVIFPDKVWYNTADGTSGSLEASFTSAGNVLYAMCKLDGTEYDTATVDDVPPVSPDNGDLWIDTSGSEHVLRQYAEATGEWVSVPTVYTKLTFTTEVTGFKANDAVTISGSTANVNGEKIIKGIGKDGQGRGYIIVVGLSENLTTQESGSVRLTRTVPEPDYVCEAQNRLWGCRYGDGYNELYASALGDATNWNRYEGISTDSWAASVGSDGEWTGAINYLGYPMFFKEDRIYRISVSSTGAHSINELAARGVQKGSEKSLCVVNELLIYKSRSDVCTYQGGFPQGISASLGTGQYTQAVAGTSGGKYYLSMIGEDQKAVLLVYDTRYGLWIKEDELRCEYFAALGDELFCIADGKLIALKGTTGTLEPYVSWMAESGMLYYTNPEKKYVSRYNIRLQMEKDAEIELYVRYDEEAEWQYKGKISATKCKTIPVPIRPKRCDHLRIRIRGRGECKVYSISRNLSWGSDV